MQAFSVLDFPIVHPMAQEGIWYDDMSPEQQWPDAAHLSGHVDTFLEPGGT
jgi:hypothetical protein